MQKLTGSLKYVFIGILLVLVFIFLFQSWKNSRTKKENPYEYNIDEYKKTNSDLITYKEAQPIKVNLEKLYAVACSEDDDIIVAGDKSIIIYNNNGDIISQFALENPAKCLAVDSDKKIYIGMQDHVEVFDFKGNKMSSWPMLNEIAILTSIAVTESDVLAADAGNKIVLHYDLTGKLVNKIGKKDLKNDIPGFVVPSPYFDLAIGYEGYLWVVNPGNHSLENYNFDGSLRSSWERTSASIEGFCGCCNPTHIAILPDGSFVTSEKGLCRVKIHNQMGDFKEVVAGPENFKEGTLGLDLAVDSSARILVLDPMRGMVRIFVRK